MLLCCDLICCLSLWASALWVDKIKKKIVTHKGQAVKVAEFCCVMMLLLHDISDCKDEKEDGHIRVVYLHAPYHALVMTRNGETSETSMDDIEISIVNKIWDSSLSKEMGTLSFKTKGC